MNASTQVRRIMLICPDCSKKSPFPEAVLVPGTMLACPCCGTELTVSHDRDTPDGLPIWRLESPEPSDERRSGA